MSELILKNGRLITGEPCELTLCDGKIIQVARFIESNGRKTIDLQGKYLSAGWIDDHVHCYEKMKLYYDYPDEIGVSKGVTSVIDAGTTGAENIDDFYQIARKKKTNVFALLNISKCGIVAQNELADLSKIQEAKITQALKDYPDFIVGIKARMSQSVVGENGLTPLELAKKIQADNGQLPLMVHIGSAPPTLSKVLDTMKAGDVLTHCFNGKENGILDASTDQLKGFVWKAYQKGIIFDIGHGTDSFNFRVAEIALKEGMKACSISTDIYVRNRSNGPVFDLATTMEKLHAIGYSWKEILMKVTAAPAKNFHLTTKGQLHPGFDADITVFELINEDKKLTDSNGLTRVTHQQIKPIKTIIGGVVYDN
ncbi:amidohydrolase/deacetylase family metallohydrolase [Enterococcus ratti]|uniref:Dihydroorotase n=1 Tax=Enterococcus ratti TaxID=150033 RepID=A0A1L8WJG5_9ENTE|nr:amidohydrolase/deacetylase family metallohydrolase [Enterococcus ratti]OJG81157.1 dihydroorotase [Enterococcus ratti]